MPNTSLQTQRIAAPSVRDYDQWPGETNESYQLFVAFCQSGHVSVREFLIERGLSYAETEDTLDVARVNAWAQRSRALKQAQVEAQQTQLWDRTLPVAMKLVDSLAQAAELVSRDLNEAMQETEVILRRKLMDAALARAERVATIRERLLKGQGPAIVVNTTNQQLTVQNPMQQHAQQATPSFSGWSAKHDVRPSGQVVEESDE